MEKEEETEKLADGHNRSVRHINKYMGLCRLSVYLDTLCVIVWTCVLSYT